MNKRVPTESNPLLEGIRVLDLSRLLPGPFCTLYLAQLGAEVIKIEEPDGGDYARALSPELFTLVNRCKQSVTLDLRRPEAVEAFKQLVAEADVVIESFRPGVMDKLGCGYETLRQINPRLVYAALTGYGQTGPYRDRAGHDMNYCAYAGALDQVGPAGGAPAMSNTQLADIAGGALTCAVGILSAVIGARASGQGALVDVGMHDGTLAMQMVALSTLRTQGHTQPRGEDMLTGALPNYSIYRCRDGKYLAVGALEPKFFQRVLLALQGELPAPLQSALSRAMAAGRRKGGGGSGNDAAKIAGLLTNPARARRRLAPMRWVLKAVFMLKTRDQWEALLAERDACVSAVLTLEEALQNEQVVARGMVDQLEGKPALRNPIRFVGAQTETGAAPTLGEHNEAVFSALGLDDATLAKLLSRPSAP
jgi:alpha-methylacyl-CoA racemase